MSDRPFCELLTRQSECHDVSLSRTARQRCKLLVLPSQRCKCSESRRPHSHPSILPSQRIPTDWPGPDSANPSLTHLPTSSTSAAIWRGSRVSPHRVQYYFNGNDTARAAS